MISVPVPDFQVEAVEQLAKQIIRHCPQPGGECGQLFEKLRGVGGIDGVLGGEVRDLRGLALVLAGHLGKSPPQPFTQVGVSFRVAGGRELLHLRHQVLAPPLQVGDLTGQPHHGGRRRLLGRERTSQRRLSLWAKDVISEEYGHDFHQVVFTHPEALGVIGVPLAAVAVVAHIRLAGKIGHLASSFSVHAPITHIAYDVGTQAVDALGLRVTVDSGLRS
ncbi:hypothetical protein AB0L06_21845 [Spirillospora sp. NPDC052269]